MNKNEKATLPGKTKSARLEEMESSKLDSSQLKERNVTQLEERNIAQLKERDEREIKKVKVGINWSVFDENNKEMAISFIKTAPLVSLRPIFNSPYFHFVSTQLKSILLKTILDKEIHPRETKLLACDFLNTFYSPIENIKDFSEIYFMIDSLKIGLKDEIRMSLRNYLILFNIKRVISSISSEDRNRTNDNSKDRTDTNDNSKISGEDRNGTNDNSKMVDNNRNRTHIDNNSKMLGKSKDRTHINNEILLIWSYLQKCPPFVEFLCKSIQIPFFRNLLILYCYGFLSNVKIDLLNIKSVEEVKNIEEAGIGKILGIFKELRERCIKETKKGEFESPSGGYFDTSKVTNYRELVDRKLVDSGLDVKESVDRKLVNGELNSRELNSRELNNKKLTNRELSDEFESYNNDINTTINTLFNSNDINNILLSIYKRIFFFMLFKNKKAFQSVKILPIFSKDEKSYIFRNIKNFKISLVNIFTQIDQKFILREISKSIKSNGNFVKQLIESIKEDKLKKEDLRIFYELYLDYLEDGNETVEIKGRSLEIFSEVFKKRIDKEIIKKVKLTSKIIVPRLTTTESNVYDNVSSLGIEPRVLFQSGSISTYNNITGSISNSKNTSGSTPTYNNITGSTPTYNNTTNDVLEFIYFLTNHNPNTIDILQLVSLLIDEPILLLKKSRIPFYNSLLKILLNCISLLNVPLMKRLVPILKRLMFYEEYTMNVGRILYALKITNFIPDDKFKDSLYVSSNTNLAENSKNTLADSNLTSNLKNNLTNNLNQSSSVNLTENYNNNLNQSSNTSPDCNTDYSRLFLRVSLNIQHPFPINTCENEVDSPCDVKNMRMAISYAYFNPEDSSIFPILSSILLLKNSLTILLLETINLKTDEFALFITPHISIFQSIYISCLEDVYASSLILQIIFKSLKTKAILPCMAIPYIFTGGNSFYILRNFKDSCINCINDCIYILCKRIKHQIHSDINCNRRDCCTGDCDDNDDCSNEYDDCSNEDCDNEYDTTNDKTINTTNDKTNDSKTNNTTNETKKYVLEADKLSSIFKIGFSNNFIFTFSQKFSMKKVFGKIDYQNDILVVYAVLRFLKDFAKKEKEYVLKDILENVSDEKIFEMVEKSKEFYLKNPKGDLPIDYLFL